MQLNGKKIVLTGASGGIGACLAKALAEEGCHLLLSGRNEGKLARQVANLPGRGHEYFLADLLKQSGRAGLLAEADTFGVDILINGLGTNQLCLLPASKDDELAQIVATNLLTPMQLSKDFLPLLSARPEALLVNIGSILGSIAYAGSSAYCASKFGLRGFSEALRRELAGSNVKVVYFAPRATDTELNSEAMQQLNSQLGNAVDTPEWVAQQLVIELKRGVSATRYLGWPEAFFVRLNSLFPSLIDKALFKQLPLIKRSAKSAVSLSV